LQLRFWAIYLRSIGMDVEELIRELQPQMLRHHSSRFSAIQKNS